MGSTSTPVSNNLAEDYDFFFAMQLVTASVLPAVLKAAIELDLLELIKKQGPDAFVSAAELATKIPATNPDASSMLDRILSLLASHSVLNSRQKTRPDGGVERLYSLGPVCRFLTKNEDGVSMAPTLLMIQDKVLMNIWYHLKDSVLDGENTFDKAHKKSFFEHNAVDPRFRMIFHEAMSNDTTIFVKKFVETYDGFEGLESLVDVGGGIGVTLNAIISKHPKIKGINFDLPHTIQHAPSYPGVEQVGGDMLVSVPKGDAILLKYILHNWNDSSCLKILTNCRQVLPENGKIIVLDHILPETPDEDIDSKIAFILDLMMLAYFPNARERTENEFQALAKQAGFKESRKVCSVLNLGIMEFWK
ncbi:caffeic acid 3-O-methyltransferase 1-like [Primulina eburnea]|uniref:caffeic acid 3-O-methyltransferase 1-like n=1 Tax=Primulina eburnea TaxID=1245227 RepID=UPI003C6C5D17